MIDKDSKLIKCRNCGGVHFVAPGETTSQCPSCGAIERNPTQAVDASAVERLEEQVVGLREDLRMHGGLSPHIEKELNNLATLAKGLAQLPETSFLVPKLYYVPSHLVDAFAAASLEAGTASSIFFLFVGLTLDKTVSMDAPASAIMLLWLVALVAAGTVLYFLNKARNVKQNLQSHPDGVVVTLGRSDQQT